METVHLFRHINMVFAIASYHVQSHVNGVNGVVSNILQQAIYDTCDTIQYPQHQNHNQYSRIINETLRIPSALCFVANAQYLPNRLLLSERV